MRIIDLLNKIANKEELPENIKIYDEQLRLNENRDNYLYEESDEYYGDEFIHWFNLNDEVEIIEQCINKDKEIERLNNIINKTINILELSAMNKGICTRPETDTIQSALLVLKGSDKE